ncbi:MAG: FtsQ-type POTRA domain-containing protein [Alphaproteobacteria bacterium]|nr:FtsQ-type POTRA domain-containing protein [Alphaproteobacteria bacterium]
MHLKTNIFKWSLKTRLKFLGVLAVVISLLAFMSSDAGRATMHWMKDVGDTVESKAQLRVAQINILWAQEAHYTSGADIEQAIGLTQGDSIFHIDLDVIRQRIEQLPWVRTCVVERYLPDTLYISIQEKVPTAIWQNNKKYHPLDELAQPIQTGKKMPSDLLLVVGSQAPEKLLELLQNLEQTPDIYQYVRAAVRIGNRRWDLKLFDVEKGVKVMLPEDEDVLSALQRLSKAEREEKILKRKVSAIDMRQKDKIILKPIEEMKKQVKGKKK